MDANQAELARLNGRIVNGYPERLEFVTGLAFSNRTRGTLPGCLYDVIAGRTTTALHAWIPVTNARGLVDLTARFPSSSTRRIQYSDCDVRTVATAYMSFRIRDISKPTTHSSRSLKTKDQSTHHQGAMEPLFLFPAAHRGRFCTTFPGPIGT